MAALTLSAFIMSSGTGAFQSWCHSFQETNRVGFVSATHLFSLLIFKFPFIIRKIMQTPSSGRSRTPKDGRCEGGRSVSLYTRLAAVK